MRLLAALLLATVASAAMFDLEQLKEFGEGLEDLFDKDKFESLLSGGKVKDLINNLKNSTQNTKNTLHLASSLHGKIHPSHTEDLSHFFKYIIQFGKEYDSNSTVSDRFTKFQNSLKRVAQRQQENPLAEYGVTKFSDLTVEEFRANFTGIKNVSDIQALHEDATPATPIRSKRSVSPASFDWRSKNGVTPVKDQKQCGCCYAFAAVGAIESQYKIKNKKDIDLSEQQAISCTYEQSAYDNNGGCDGGSSPGVLRYAIDKGLTTEANWKYTSGDNLQVPSCQSKPVAFKISKQQQLPQDNEDNTAKVVATVGPVVTYVDADQMMDYKSGILDAPKPSGGWQINHGVLIVGYGSANGVDYWVIKNSWGTGWGESGFVRIRRGKNSLQVADYNYAVYA
ncbi:unnamed protein product [Bursaphelenchus xylophilus]|nr:unnamed protein product [Bursaphelenchus xylophilus]CAG9124842.1 unnamed protein product [Bursaphelenchus xylophilus]